jgi:hypothetical protein
MPYWLGMLTEDHHPHPDVARVIQQVSFELYFRERPVCARPECVRDPGMDLAALIEWSNLRKAACALLEQPHEPFGTRNVEASAKSVVRTMMRESRLTIVELAAIFERQCNAEV